MNFACASLPRLGACTGDGLHTCACVVHGAWHGCGVRAAGGSRAECRDEQGSWPGGTTRREQCRGTLRCVEHGGGGGGTVTARRVQLPRSRVGARMGWLHAVEGVHARVFLFMLMRWAVYRVGAPAAGRLHSCVPSCARAVCTPLALAPELAARVCSRADR